MSYKVDLEKIPDWVATVLVAVVTSLFGLACMWGSLKSEVQAQVTAQAVDASDIKTLISGQAEMKATVNSIAQDQKQLHQDLLSLMNRHASLNGPTRPRLNATGISQ